MRGALYRLSEFTVTKALAVLVLAALPAAAVAQQHPGRGYVPPRGVVPDSATAVRLAETILVPIYGAAAVSGQRPFGAKLVGGVWEVTGSLPSAPEGYESVGGVAVVRIARDDGRILYIEHGK